MKRFCILLLSTIISLSVTYAQGFGYDSKTDIGNGLYKVKSGDFYGVIDANDNVVVSIEYQDIVFKNGRALLTKDNVLYGLIDSLGSVKNFSGTYKVHPKYKYVYEGYIPVSFVKNWMFSDKWGYIDVDEKPLKIKQKIKNIEKNNRTVKGFINYFSINNSNKCFILKIYIKRISDKVIWKCTFNCYNRQYGTYNKIRRTCCS